MNLKPTMCKALAHAGVFVDTNKLCEGIYESDIPHLQNFDMNKEKYKQIAEDIFSKDHPMINEFMDNLDKCEFVDVVVYTMPLAKVLSGGFDQKNRISYE